MNSKKSKLEGKNHFKNKRFRKFKKIECLKEEQIKNKVEKFRNFRRMKILSVFKNFSTFC